MFTVITPLFALKLPLPRGWRASPQRHEALFSRSPPEPPGLPSGWITPPCHPHALPSAGTPGTTPFLLVAPSLTSSSSIQDSDQFFNSVFFFLEASLNFHITPWTERSSSVVPLWLYVILSSHNSLYSDVITFRICFENFEAKGRSYSCL